MNNAQILRKRRKHLAEKLQHRYGLREEKARLKAELWLRSIHPQPVLAAQLDRRWAPRQDVHPDKSRSAAATRL